MFRFFARLFARDLSVNFNAVRMLGPPPQPCDGPLVVFSNHPSWWDAALFIWLSSRMFGDRRCFAPMDAHMLARYPFFGRVGAFGVQAGTLSGASNFLAVSERILSKPNGMLLVNAQGQFSDVRTRPLALSPGLAHLAKRSPETTFVPLAIEYAFWDERRPNLLLKFGEPLSARELVGLKTSIVATRLSSSLENAMDALAEAAMVRDPRRFRTLLAGRIGINVFYDTWRRARAAVRGQRFSPAHSDRS